MNTYTFDYQEQTDLVRALFEAMVEKEYEITLPDYSDDDKAQMHDLLDRWQTIYERINSL